MYVFVVRHGARADKQGKGSTVEYRASCAPGHEYDPPLTAFGRDQAFETGKEIARICGLGGATGAPIKVNRIKAIVSSPFIRCVETATAISVALNQVANSSGSDDGTKTLPPSDILLHPGLSEWLGSDLFPTKPHHLQSTLLNEFTMRTVQQVLSESGVTDGGSELKHEVVAEESVPKLVPAVEGCEALERHIIAQWPEGKPEATQRNASTCSEMVQQFNSSAIDVRCSSTSCGGDALGDETGLGRPLQGVDAVILVTHQYGVHSIVSEFINNHLRQKEAATKVNEHGSSAKNMKKKHFNFKKEGVAQAQLAASCDEGFCCFGKSASDLCNGSFPVDFGLASVSLMLVEDPINAPDTARCLVLSQAPKQSAE